MALVHARLGGGYGGEMDAGYSKHLDPSVDCRVVMDCGSWCAWGCARPAVISYLRGGKGRFMVL